MFFQIVSTMGIFLFTFVWAFNNSSYIDNWVSGKAGIRTEEIPKEEDDILPPSGA